MKKSISSLLLLSLAFAPSVYGWGVKNMEAGSPEGEMKRGGVNNPDIHLHGDDENGYLKFSYLLFKPHLDDMHFATLVTNGSGLVNGSEGAIKPKSPHFDWSSGVRVNVGRYLPHHDNWDIGFITTYYYSDADNHLSVPNNSQTFATAYLAPQTFEQVLGDFSTKVSDNWRMNFFLYDLGIAREYFLTPKVLARPYLGVRGMTLYQHNNSRYESFFFNTSGVPVAQSVNSKLKSSMETWGVGVKGAFDLVFAFPAHFSIFGNFGGSLLYGHYNAHQNVTNGKVHPSLLTYSPRVSNHGYELQTGLEGSFGLKWEYSFPQNHNRITLSAAFEGQRWFDINKWSRVDETSIVSGQVFIPNAVQSHGDLTLVGFTFALLWDF